MKLRAKPPPFEPQATKYRRREDMRRSPRRRCIVANEVARIPGRRNIPFAFKVRNRERHFFYKWPKPLTKRHWTILVHAWWGNISLHRNLPVFPPLLGTRPLALTSTNLATLIKQRALVELPTTGGGPSCAWLLRHLLLRRFLCERFIYKKDIASATLVLVVDERREASWG
ncbi:hypothetical protein J6590_060277 [Homalodisca vitripennis]|nr:hypothetical protein J6590_060277 [Homalodisca vitripennis]